jgi:DnaJ-class molecular chaperone
MEDKLIKVDKNGTKYYANYTCQRCGGLGGSDKWQFTGWTCYECGGSGVSNKPDIYKVYTPEYEAKLNERRAKKAAKRLAEAEAKAEETRREWLAKNQFNENGDTYVFIGNTYEIKDELKAL